MKEKQRQYLRRSDKTYHFFQFDLRHASSYLLKGPQRIGRVYKKAMFRQYTDGTYDQKIPGPAWLGFLGPILRAEVGDVIIVHLKNFASRSYSIHPHGVFYEKDSEGKDLQSQTHQHNWYIQEVPKL